MKSKKKHSLECVSMLCLYTSELSCFPKYISDEMAFTSSPNFFRASPVSESAAASGFLLVVGLITVTNRKNNNMTTGRSTLSTNRVFLKEHAELN